MGYGRFTDMLREDVVGYLENWGFATFEKEETDSLRNAAYLNEITYSRHAAIQYQVSERLVHISEVLKKEFKEATDAENEARAIFEAARARTSVALAALIKANAAKPKEVK